MKKIIILLVFTLIVAGCGDSNGGNPNSERIKEIAQCLADKDAKMYGAVWCGHCNQQKKAFGEAFELIDYIECDPNTNLETAKLCVKNKIESVPAWEVPGREILFGYHTPEALAEEFGC